MEKKILGLGLLLFGILFICIGSLYAFYYSVMMLFALYILLLTIGTLFLIYGILIYLKGNYKRVGLISLFASILTLSYLIIWFLSIMNDWSFDIQLMFSDNWLTPLYLTFFSITTGLIANKKVEKINKFGLAGLTIAILCLFLIFINIMYYNSTIIGI